jgi:hypothetical protein
VQHALRAYTPRDQKAVRAAAETFRPNPKLDTVQTIMELAVGEGLVSFLTAGGTPAVVERALVLPPASRIGAIAPEERRAILDASPLKGQYEQTVDRESAFERLRATESPTPGPATRDTGVTGTGGWQRPGEIRTRPSPLPQSAPSRRGGAQPKAERGTMERIILGDGRRQGLAEAMAKSVVRQIGSSVGRQILRGMLGSLLR